MLSGIAPGIVSRLRFWLGWPRCGHIQERVVMRRLVAVLLFSFLLSCSGGMAWAQVLYGSIVGTVTDQSGALVPNAAVKAVSPQTGEVRSAATDQSGRYTIGNVLPGTYDVQISGPGFRTVTTSNVTATINTVTRVDVQMQLGSQTQEVNVSGAATALQTDKSDTHTELISARDGKPAAAELSQLSKPLQPGSGRHARRISRTPLPTRRSARSART